MKKTREPMMGSENTPAEVESKDTLLKQAADALDEAQRRDQAIKIAFELVERGKEPPYESLAKFEEKVASLMEKDLRVVEEALSMNIDLPELGKVASGPTLPDDATAAFYHRLADD